MNTTTRASAWFSILSSGWRARAAIFALAGGLCCLSGRVFCQPPAPVLIEIEGAHVLSAEKLRTQAKSSVEALERPGHDHADADDAAYYFRRQYFQAGYASATVNYELKREPEGLKVVFHIQEGPRVRISRLNFTGNEFFTGKKLTALLQAQWSSEGIAGLFVQEAVERGAEQIRQLYAGQGFIQAQIPLPTTVFNPAHDQVEINFRITEGVRYIIRGIVFQGDTLPLADPLRAALSQSAAGQPYYYGKVLLLSGQLQEAYQDAGYPDVNIDVAPGQDNQSGNVILTVTIHSGPKVTISHIVVQGNKKVDSDFIQKHVGFKPGDDYSQKGKQKTFQSLYATGLFSRIQVELESDSPTANHQNDDSRDWGREPPTRIGREAGALATAPGKPAVSLEASARTLRVTVAEKSLRRIYVEPGWGTYEFLRLGVGYEQFGFFGWNRQVGLDGKLSFKERSVQAKLQERDFLFDGLTSQYTGNAGYRIEPAYIKTEYDLSLSLQPRLEDGLGIILGYKLQDINLENMAPVNTVLGPSYFTQGTASLKWSWEKRDNVLYPTEGYLLLAGLDEVSPLRGSQWPYLRGTWEARGYLPLAQGSTIALRMQSGLICMAAGHEPIPVSELFFNGGENSVRSFSQSSLGPKALDGTPAGGLGFTTLNAEFRQQVYGAWHANLFFDYGNITPSWHRGPVERASDFRAALDDFWLEFRPAVGTGILYLLPVGTARLEVAFNPDYKVELKESQYRVQFCLGTAF